MTESTEEKSAVMKVPQQLINTMQITNYEQLIESFNVKTDYDNVAQISVDATGAASYTIASYISPTIGMTIGKGLNLNITITYYLCRILSFITFLLITFYSIKIIPFGKTILFILSFNPIWIQQAIAITADTMINACAFLLLAYILYLYEKKKQITNKEIMIYGILTIMISFMKMVYFPLSALGLLLYPKIKEKQKRKIILIIGLTVLFAGLNYLLSTQYTYPKSHQLEYGIDSMKQLSWIIRNPIDYAIVILKTTLYNGEFYLYTMLGRYLANHAVVVPGVVIILYSYLCLLSPLLEENKIELKKYSKIIIVLITIAIYILIETGLYMTWTSVGANIVEGVQGRYFHPIVLLLPFIFIKSDNKIKFKNKRTILSLLLLLINLVAIYTIIGYFNY